MHSDLMGIKRTKAEILSNVKDVVWSRKTDNNEVTYQTSDGWKKVRYHFTDIYQVSPNQDHVIIDTGGWNTVSTRKHLLSADKRVRNPAPFLLNAIHKSGMANNFLSSMGAVEVQGSKSREVALWQVFDERVEFKKRDGVSFVYPDVGYIDHSFAHRFLGEKYERLSAFFEKNGVVRIFSRGGETPYAWLQPRQQGYELWPLKQDLSGADGRYKKPMAYIDSVCEGIELATAIKKF